jgi:hypothetical protein
MKLTQEQKDRINKLISFLNKRRFCKDRVAYWGGVTVNGGTAAAGNQYCHAELGYWGQSSEFIASRIQWDNNSFRRLPNKVVDDFLFWLTSRSPYTKAFVLKGGKKIRKLGYVVVRTDIPANFLAGALFAHRAITEHKGSIALCWWHLKEAGLHPDLAFCHAHQISAPDHVHVQEAGSVGWHVAWNGYAPKSTILAFKNRKPKGEVLGKYNEMRVGIQPYAPVQGMWGRTDGGERNNQIRQVMKAVKDGGVVKKPVNPFAAGNMGQVRVPLDAFCKLWVPILIEEYGKDNE